MGDQLVREMLIDLKSFREELALAVFCREMPY